jgi:hypothetical protein
VNPPLNLVTVVNSRLADAGFRDQIRQLHAKQASLVDMVEALGLTSEMSGDVRAVLEGLSKADVDAIRAATLEMLDRNENQMPLDCNVDPSAVGTPISVSVVDEVGKRTIQVRAT